MYCLHTSPANEQMDIDFRVILSWSRFIRMSFFFHTMMRQIPFCIFNVFVSVHSNIICKKNQHKSNLWNSTAKDENVFKIYHLHHPIWYHDHDHDIMMFVVVVVVVVVVRIFTMQETSWNKLEQVETSWNKLKQVETSWHNLKLAETSWVKLKQVEFLHGTLSWLSALNPNSRANFTHADRPDQPYSLFFGSNSVFCPI